VSFVEGENLSISKLSIMIKLDHTKSHTKPHDDNYNSLNYDKMHQASNIKNITGHVVILFSLKPDFNLEIILHDNQASSVPPLIRCKNLKLKLNKH